jgi:hypothetical protein
MPYGRGVYTTTKNSVKFRRWAGCLFGLKGFFVEKRAYSKCLCLASEVLVSQGLFLTWQGDRRLLLGLAPRYAAFNLKGPWALFPCKDLKDTVL